MPRFFVFVRTYVQNADLLLVNEQNQNLGAVLSDFGCVLEQPLSFTQAHGMFFRFRVATKIRNIFSVGLATFQLILCGEVGI